MNLDTTKSIADITQESVHTSDDIDIGDIEATSKDTVVVKRGIINVHYYYIPVSLIEGSVWLTITEQEIKDKYEKDSEPDPAKYFMINQGYSNFDWKNIPVIPSISKKR
jgi:hypothetical protein